MTTKNHLKSFLQSGSTRPINPSPLNPKTRNHQPFKTHSVTHSPPPEKTPPKPQNQIYIQKPKLGFIHSSMSEEPKPVPCPLIKHKSWSSSSSSSSDLGREEAWLRRKGNHQSRRRIARRSKSVSVTDDDLDELKGCFELGFGFDSPDLDQRKLSDTLPALELYLAVNKQYNDNVLMLKRSSSSSSMASSSDHQLLDSSSSSSLSSSPTPSSIFEPGDRPQVMKTRLKHWAQLVACSVKQSSSSSTSSS